MANAILECILTILFGWFGVHKFIKKEKSLGILYLCTMGLFGIGWIIDSINSVKKVLDISNKKQTKNNSATKANNSVVLEKNQADLNKQERLKELNKLKNRTVKVIDVDNKEKEVKQYKNFLNEESNIVLLSESDGDNKIYHLWYDCYESWNDEFKSKFSGWKEEKFDSIKDEYRICKRCEESCYRHNNPNATITGYDFDYYYDKYIDIDDIDYTYLLTKHEYGQLQVFNRLNDFNKIYKELKLKNKYFKKNDVLWAIYNDARLEYESKKDTTMLSVVFDRQSDILIIERKYNQALIMFASSLYLILYEFDIVDNDIFELHINKRRKDKLNKLLTKTNKSTNDFASEFEGYVQDIIPNLYDSKKAQTIIQNISKKI